MQALPADGATAPRACCFSPGLSATGRLAWRWGVMPDPLTLLLLPTLRGERVILRQRRESDIDDRLRHPIDPAEEDGYGSSWRREWDGRRYHTREHLAAGAGSAEPGCYTWAVEYEGHCIGSAGLRVDTDQHCAAYTVGLFVASLRGQRLGR
jgi:RimJ/RimL family protein N-acetyltransferase